MQQTHRDIRVMAIDDGSTDGSDEVLRAAAELDRRITPIFRENRGLIATLNEGLALAETDYIARMDADDIAYPDRLADQLRTFDANPGLGLLGTNFDTVYGDMRVTPAAAPMLTGPTDRLVLGRFCTSLRHPSVVFRRSRLGGADLRYDARYPHAEDFDLFRRLALTTAIAQTPKSHLAYRVHTSSVTSTRQAQMCRTHLDILEENLTRHYPPAAGTGMNRIGEHIDTDSVDAAADMIRGLTSWRRFSPTMKRRHSGLGSTPQFISCSRCSAGRGPIPWPTGSSTGRTAGGRSGGASARSCEPLQRMPG
jgi:glycosyltransferase involved in cell wall biosynthesis